MMFAVFVMLPPVSVPVRPSVVADAMLHWAPVGITVPPT